MTVTWTYEIIRTFPGGPAAFEAHKRRAEQDIRGWLTLPAGQLLCRAVRGSEFPDDANIHAANVAFLAVRQNKMPNELWKIGASRNPWRYKKLPGITAPCMVFRWWMWLPEKTGFLEATWHPDLGPEWLVRGLPPDAHSSELKRLQGIIIHRGRGGRKNLENITAHPWRDVADRALELQEAHPEMSVEYIESYRVKIDGPTQSARTRKLSRWMERRRTELRRKFMSKIVQMDR